MLSRSEKENINKSKRKLKIKSLCLKCINFLCKFYLYLGFSIVLVISVASTVYKSYWHQEPPFNYQQYITTDMKMEIVLTTVLTSFFVSGVIALATEQKKKPVEKKVNHELNKRRRSKRRFRKAG